VNSSLDSAPTVELKPRPSYSALRGLLALHAVPLICIPLLLNGSWLPLVLAAAVGASWLYVRHRPALGFGPRALTRLMLHGDGRWTLEDGADMRQSAELLGSSRALANIVILNFRLEHGGRRSRILFGDEVDAGSMRRLRSRLFNGPARAVKPLI